MILIKNEIHFAILEVVCFGFPSFFSTMTMTMVSCLMKISQNRNFLACLQIYFVVVSKAI